MKVFVDGEEVEVPEGAKVKDALEAAGKEVPEDVVVAVFKGEEEAVKETDRFRVVFEGDDRELEVTVAVEDERLAEVCERLEGARVSWVTLDEIGVGPVDVSDLDYKIRRGVEVSPHSVIVVLPSNDPTDAYVLFTKRRMAVEYVCTDITGDVTAGREFLNDLDTGYEVVDTGPLMERVTRQVVHRVSPDDELEDGDHLYTRVVIELDDGSPVSAEHLLNTVEMDGGRLKVGFKCDTYDSFEPRPFYDLPDEKTGMRDRGTVTVRNTGSNEGNIYVYRKSRTPIDSHNVVGEVTSGMEIVDVAVEGDEVLVEIVPERLNFVGLSLEEAKKLAEKKGIEIEVEGEGDIVVDQEPKETLNVIKEGRVKVKVVPEDQVIEVELFEDETPRTVEYFRRVTGMLDRPVGKLKVHFAYSDLGMVMFEGDEKLGRKLVPENTPKDTVEAGTLGVTNQAKKHAGLIGVRLEPSDEYGPTGETFEGTNIIGRVVKGMDILRSLDQSDIGSVIYVKEVRRSENTG